jgi:hypothetical protein
VAQRLLSARDMRAVLVVSIAELVARHAAADPPRPVEIAFHFGAALVDVASAQSSAEFGGAGPWADLEIGHRFGRITLASFAGVAYFYQSQTLLGGYQEDVNEHMTMIGVRMHVHAGHALYGLGTFAELWHESGTAMWDVPIPYEQERVVVGGEIHAGYTVPTASGLAIEVFGMGTFTLGDRSSRSARLALGLRW